MLNLLDSNRCLTAAVLNSSLFLFENLYGAKHAL